MELTDKNIILTGASSGIGLSLLHKLSDYRCNIIAVARNIDRIPKINDRVITYSCDISKAENVDGLFDFAAEKMGSVDIFIANAGFAYYEQLQTPDWHHIERIYQTNVFSGIYSALKMKQLKGDQPYRMIITASAMSFMPLAGYTLYSSTKTALHGFAQGYRPELKKGQLLQMVYPIGTRTEFFDRAAQDTPAPWPSQKSESVAKAIVKGIRRDRQSIFPSRLFWCLNALNHPLPFIKTVVAGLEILKFKRWQRQQPGPSTGV